MRSSTRSRWTYPAVGSSVVACAIIGAFLVGPLIPHGSQATDIAEIKDQLRSHYPDADINHIAESPVEGLYEVYTGGRLLYADARGEYLLESHMTPVGESASLTEETLRAYRAGRINDIDANDAVIFRDHRATEDTPRVTIFFDPTCAYCAEKHRELLPFAVNGRIEIRYLMFAPDGPNGEIADQLRGIWCADDPQLVLTRAARGETPRPMTRSQCDAPVAEHYNLALDVGLRGTPYTVFDNGFTIPGAEPAGAIVQIANEIKHDEYFYPR